MIEVARSDVRTETPYERSFFVWITASLGALSIGAMVAAVGIAKLLVAEEAFSWSGGPFRLTSVGSAVVLGGLAIALWKVQGLPQHCSDCDQYGRHLFGLTFLLLVIGLSGAIGTSTLAWAGGLGFSASALIEAGDPKHILEAEQKQQEARASLQAGTKAVAAAEQAFHKSEQSVKQACTLPLSEGAPISSACQMARLEVDRLEDELGKKRTERDAAEEVVSSSKEKCDNLRAKSKRALFFLLSLSTMTSLFGASFYVVNRVRMRRPAKQWENQDPDHPPSSFEPLARASASAGPAMPHGAAMAKRADAETNENPADDEQAEPFDVYAFWSGTFFRVGEAVLFTLAFFWMIWTTDRYTYVVWLPVLGLFIGMFVKTGETIIFRLGMRLLHAAEEFLPVTPRDSPSKPSTSTPAGGGSDPQSRPVP